MQPVKGMCCCFQGGINLSETNRRVQITILMAFYSEILLIYWVTNPIFSHGIFRFFFSLHVFQNQELAAWRFSVQIQAGIFLCGVYMFSRCLLVCSVGILVDSHNPKTFLLCSYVILTDCRCRCMRVHARLFVSFACLDLWWNWWPVQSVPCHSHGDTWNRFQSPWDSEQGEAGR